MSQITSGVRSILSIPLMYSLFQNIMGATKDRKFLVSEYLKPYEGMRVLDIGCGPADILEFMKGVEYYGFDISADYIAMAKKKFKGRGNFHSRTFSEEEIESLPKIDLVIAIGVLHHMSNEVVDDLMKIVTKVLAPGGRVFTSDPCMDAGQNIFARMLINLDRGQHVRTAKQYSELFRDHFVSVKSTVRHTAFIPYTHCFIECQI